MNPNGLFEINGEVFHAEKICGICLGTNGDIEVMHEGGVSHVKVKTPPAALRAAVARWKAALKRCQPKLLLGKIKSFTPARSAVAVRKHR